MFWNFACRARNRIDWVSGMDVMYELNFAIFEIKMIFGDILYYNRPLAPEFTFLWIVTVPIKTYILIMTSWHRNTSRITGPLLFVTAEFPHKGLVDVAIVSLNKLLNKQLSCLWFETSWCSSDVPEMCSIPSHAWNCTVLSSMMAKYEILKIHIITANLLGYSFCLRVF